MRVLSSSLQVNSPTFPLSVHPALCPSHLSCSQGSSDCLGLLVGQPVPIWKILIGSPTPWVESLKNKEHLLYLTPLYTKLIVILQSMSKMGLLGAISFSLVLVSLTQVNRSLFYVKTCKSVYRYTVVSKFLHHVADYIVFLIYRYPKVQKVQKVIKSFI